MAKSERRHSRPTKSKPHPKSTAPLELAPIVTSVSYASLRRKRGAQKNLTGAMKWLGGNVLDFFIVGFRLERPAGGGAVRQTLKVDGMPTKTKNFYPWLMHLEYQFVDTKTGDPVDRPIWIQFTDLYAYKQGGDWYLQVTGGWADKGDQTDWWGFVGVIGIATS
jgi:hypothetical protein